MAWRAHEAGQGESTCKHELHIDSLPFIARNPPLALFMRKHVLSTPCHTMLWQHRGPNNHELDVLG
eukprot:6189751-Amphidinium_carterae.1